MFPIWSLKPVSNMKFETCFAISFGMCEHAHYISDVETVNNEWYCVVEFRIKSIDRGFLLQSGIYI